MKKLTAFFISLSLLFIYSCKSSNEYKPNAGGKAGELLIVIKQSYKNTEAGAFLKEVLSRPYLGLPQEEPLFNVQVATYENLNDFMKTMRNLVMVNISDEFKMDTIKYYKDAWAKGQAMVRVNARSEKDLVSLVKRNESRLIDFFNKAERERAMKYYRKYINKEFSDKVKDKFGFFISVPTGYKRFNEKKDFLWMSEGNAGASEGIVIFSYPYGGKGTFLKESLLNKLNEVLKKRIPGPSDGSYMTVEMVFPPIYRAVDVNGEKVAEIRGLWKVVGDMMGGPWIMHAHLDKENKRVIVLYGYVYAPEEHKREKIRQMEAVLYSYKKVEHSTADEK
jgi:hypothetical protein